MDSEVELGLDCEDMASDEDTANHWVLRWEIVQQYTLAAEQVVETPDFVATKKAREQDLVVL